MTWRRRAATVAAGVLIFLILNFVRVAALYELWQAEAYAAYELLHSGGGLFFTMVLLGAAATLARPRPAVVDGTH
jgi:exosortase/archaeosortase family protein